MTEAFTLDLNRCTGCEACRLACSIENELGFDLERSWRQVVTVNAPRHPGIPTYHLSLACNHCGDAPCARACPALAIEKNPASGIVKIDPGKCIACRYCAWACPYEALRYDEAASVMTKCTFCDHRLAQGLEPACVTACPTGALGRGDLEGVHGADRVPGFPDPVPRPSIRFTPLRAGGAPESSLVGAGTTGGSPVNAANPGPAETGLRAADRSSTGITLTREWPLLTFTLMASILVGWFAGGLLGAPPPQIVIFAGLGAAAMLVSVQHLGRKTRAWRAILNVRRSWLSREITGFGAFAGLGILSLFPGTPAALGWVAAIAGFLALFAMDRVYDPVRTRDATPLHSADVVLTGLLLAGVFAREPWLAGPVALVKAALFLIGPNGRRWTAGFAFDLLRLGVGFVAPAALWSAGAPGGTLPILLLVLIGEIADRCAFYLGLEITTPRRQAETDLAAVLARSGSAVSKPA
jgi:Fe-S-cluster-containing dehydrogenase component